MPEGLHTLYHEGLDQVGLGRWMGTDWHKGLSSQEQAENFMKFADYTIGFDRKHGTKLWEAVKQIAQAK